MPQIRQYWWWLVLIWSGCAAPMAHHAPVPAQVTIRADLPGTVVPLHFLGLNLSYFNDTKDIWARNRVQDVIQTARVGALRYPGGQETSFFHWRHPGVNGYEDIWDNPALFGTAVGRGRFQLTWVSPEKWESNTEFMDFARYIEVCRAIGAEPVVGLNLSSGRKHQRRAEGLSEALDWLRAAKQAGARVLYWYFDNETWNREANLTMTDAEYIEEVLYYGRAIRAEFPQAKIIVNPFSSEHIGDWLRLERFLRATGEVVDFVDVHYYWEWGRSSVARWRAQKPLCSSDQWKPPSQVMPYRDEIARIKAAAARVGFPQIGVMILEWNIGPSAATRELGEAPLAVMQSAMLMQFLEAQVEMACLWPLIWPSNPEVWPQADRFPSIVTYREPYRRTLSHDLLRMVGSVAGCARLPAASPSDGLTAQAFLCAGGEKIQLLILNQNEGSECLELSVGDKGSRLWRIAGAEVLSMRQGLGNLPASAQGNALPVQYQAPGLSFSLVTLTQEAR